METEVNGIEGVGDDVGRVVMEGEILGIEVESVVNRFQFGMVELANDGDGKTARESSIMWGHRFEFEFSRAMEGKLEFKLSGCG